MNPELSIDELLTTTRSVRKRLDLERPVERAVIEECLTLALQAPNGSNHQQWCFLILDDPAQIARAAEIYRAAIDDYTREIDAGQEQYRRDTSPGASRMGESVAHLREHLHRVPALLIPTLQDRFGVVRERESTIYHEASQWASIAPAVWSFMLALRSRGLGSAWTTIHLRREAEMAELLGIPYEKHVQAGLFPIAYTIGTRFRAAPRRPLDEVLRYNAW